ncbi:very long chain fatty acid elongase 4-like [Clavelina lepadiformis]|uniref:very long chain fatty acid elongase 4-like n=1 Tax=Clavelina lepadiformis TaxID=159417 RepID=UPI0040435961
MGSNMPLLKTLSEYYDNAIKDRADPRTDGWFLVHSPWPPLCILLVYLVVCINAKRMMQNVPAFRLRGILLCYNTALVFLSAYMFYEFLVASYLAEYNLFCQPVDYSTSPLAIRMAKVCWWYFISKYIELLDTVFFILRKKFNQVSFLHVYHHSTMLINWWLGVKYVAGGQSFFIGMLNSFVHIIMYTYYALSCFGPTVQKYLWWKKYLTVLQLVQFGAIFVHCFHNLWTECDFPDWLNGIVCGYMISLILFFLNFYIQSYLKGKQSKEKRN